MSQLLDPPPSDRRDQIVCCYVNATSKIQIARIANVPNWYFERVVFPGQRLVFETVPEGMLEIHTGMMASAIISDTIPCDRLCLEEADGFLFSPPETQQRIEEMNEGKRDPAAVGLQAEPVS